MALNKTPRVVRPEFRAELLARDGRCLICGRMLDETTINPHHISTRGSGGDDCLENGISLCYWCHEDVHRGHTMVDDVKIYLTQEVLRWLLVYNHGYEYDAHLLGDDIDRLVAEEFVYRYTFKPAKRF